MKVESFFSYNGKVEPRPAPGALLDKIKPWTYLGMAGEYRCACVGSSEIPLGQFYQGCRSNPEWILKVS